MMRLAAALSMNILRQCFDNPWADKPLPKHEMQQPAASGAEIQRSHLSFNEERIY